MSIVPDMQNSEIMVYVLQKLFDISSRKTTQQQALSTMSGLIKKFEDKYGFLRHVELKDTRFSELEEPISIMSDVDTINSDEVGKALYDIIRNMNMALGKNAGHFFIKELRTRMDENYITTIEDMGLDLGLMQLEFEVNQMTRKLD